MEAELAEEYAIYYAYIDSLEQHLNYETGEVVIGNNLAKLNLTKGYRYLDPENTEHIVTDTWGNPPINSLGMIIPEGVNPYGINGWGIIISYEEEGHIDDEDAVNLDFDELLVNMINEVEAENAIRVEKGYDTYALKGWADDPYYDPEDHKIVWALNLHFGMEEDDYPGTLNYNMRVLGREGVLILNAVSGMEQMNQVKGHMAAVLPSVSFLKGNRYEDYNPSTDNLAGYGIGALVAGKVAAKTGILTAMTTFIMKGWKFLLIVLAAIVAMIRKLIKTSRGTANAKSV
jgi:uncharacterized membrane-anchored protein